VAPIVDRQTGTKAQIAKYTTQMTPYKGVLSATQIKQVAEPLDSVT
jgi:hypothetical protein